MYDKVKWQKVPKHYVPVQISEILLIIFDYLSRKHNVPALISPCQYNWKLKRLDNDIILVDLFMMKHFLHSM